MKATFREYKDQMTRDGYNTRLFTKKFFLTFDQAAKTRAYNRDNGIDDSYTGRVWLSPSELSAEITLHHAFDAVYNSDFYIRAGSAYCHFLTLYNRE